MSDITPHDARITLRAGGIAPLETPLPDDERSSPVGAHAYTHPAIAGRVVVQLSAAAVVAGTDAEMAALGFSKERATKDLGLVRYRRLGFPAWPLVHDPSKARFALEVTQDLRKAKKRAASKPGAAREAFDAIGKRLERSVPHFLPSFWEEAGRVMADAGGAAMAAQCFEKARDAERAHALAVDADDRDAVFLEFALLGALSAKTLSEYAKELERSRGSVEGYARFRSIAVKRAFGGFPPWAGMAKELRALAKAAGMAGPVEDDLVVGELLATPAIGRSPREFWTTFKPSIVRLAREDDALRSFLRGLFPTPKGDSEEQRKKLVVEWLGVLDEMGAFDELPDAGLSEWMTKLIRWAGDVPRVSALLRGLAPRLTAPISVVVRQPYRQSLSLSLAELALSLGVQLADPDGNSFHGIPIDTPCDPACVAADDRYGPKLVDLVASCMGVPTDEAAMRGKLGFDRARRTWLEERVRSFEGLGLVRFEDALKEIVKRTTPATWSAVPDLRARLLRARVKLALTLVLREGIFDELGWPALEDSVTKLGPDVLFPCGAFPHLVVHNGTHATVLDHTGVVLEHDFLIDATHESVTQAMYADGQLLVVLTDKTTHASTAYWSAQPTARFRPKGLWGSSGLATTLPDGSVTLGERAFRSGDTSFGWFGRHAFDGTAVFKLVHRSGESTWAEYDAIKDKAGRSSRPRFFEEFVKPGTKLVAACLRLHPVPVPSSPLGIKDGFYGFRVRVSERDPNCVEAERIDGEAIQVALHAAGLRVDGLLSLPGRSAPLALQYTGWGAHETRAILRTRDGDDLANLDAHPWASAGSERIPPHHFWHYLTPRDEPGSLALRALTDDAAERLLAAGRRDLEASSESKRPTPHTLAAALALGITSERLARGVAGIVKHATDLDERLRAFVEPLARSDEGPTSDEFAGPGALLLRIVNALKRGVEVVIERVEVDFVAWVELPRGKAMRARAPMMGASAGEAHELVGALARAQLDDGGAKVRVLRLKQDRDFVDPGGWRGVRIARQAGSTFAIQASSQWAIERSTDGVLRVPTGYSVLSDAQPPALDEAFVAAYAALGREAATFEAAHVDIVAARAGLSRAEAGILLLGAPIDQYGRDFLGKERREALGLKVAQAEAARGLFKDKLPGVIDEVFERAAREPSSLVGSGWAERLGDAWREVVGAQVEVPEALLVAAQKDLPVRGNLRRMLSALAAPASFTFEVGKHTVLSASTTWTHEPGKDGLDADHAEEVALLLAWTAFVTPVGDPIRSGLPVLFEKLRAGLASPDLLWALGAAYAAVPDEKDLEAIVALLPGPQVLHPHDSFGPCTGGRDTGPVAVGKYGKRLMAAFRPGKVTRWNDPTLLAVMKRVGVPTVDGLTRPVAVARWILGDDLRALVTSAATSTLPAGSFEANPALSAPKLVAQVERARSLSTHAATLYLQLLALAEPTEKSVRLWNSWSAKTYAAAVAELAAKELAVLGKRERAQREVFLPGGFSKGVGKNLPMEEWKAPLYAALPLARNVPGVPLVVLFERAWRRVEDGEGPGFEKVR